MNQHQGFTILELSIVIIILVILSSLTMASLSSVRENNRNTRRVADITEMQAALKMYYRDQGDYPLIVTPGAALVYGSSTYIAQWPQNPTPRNDGSCPNADYIYTKVLSAGTPSYFIQFCLSAATGEVGPGTSYASPDHIATCLPDCVKSCSPGSDGCGGTCSNVAACAAGETCVSSHCIKD